MKVVSKGITDGVIHDKYGKHGEDFNVNGVPSRSIPFEISDAPKGTKSFALFLEDKDACPISGGFSWVHWVAANITRNKIEENESQTAKDFVQGLNSWISIQGGQQSKELSAFYGGMAPPDQAHTYELHIFALDCLLDLENGFMFHEMFKKMDGHILEQAVLKGAYRN